MAKIRKFASFVWIVLIGICSSGRVQAQNPSNYYIEDPRTFYAGIIAGGNFSQVDGDNYAGYHKVGLNVGGIIYTHLAEHVAVSLEILFSQKGASGKEQSFSLSGATYNISKYQLTLNYAEIPIQICYFDKRRSHFGGGFSYSQLINANESITTEPANPIDLTKYPFKKSDINFIIGGNLHLWKGLFFNLRFQYSLFSIRHDKPAFYMNDRNRPWNNMWTARLMYLF